MKKKAFLIIALISVLATSAVWAQTAIIDLGIFRKQDDPTKMEVRLRPVQDITNGVYSAGIFTVGIPSSYGATLTPVQGSAEYGYSFAGPVGQKDGYDYYRYQFAGSVYTVNWQKGQEYPLLTLQINGDLPAKGEIKLVTGDTWTRDHNADYYQELNGMEVQRRFYYLPKRKKINFQATAMPARTVKLDWELESEVALDFTEVEYSTDGLEFTTIGQVPAHKAEDGAPTAYLFSHENVTSDINFYRLLLIDIEGVEEYTQVKVINFNDLDSDFSVFPNPTQGPVMLLSRNLEKYSEGVNYQLIDGNGRLLFGNVVNADNFNLDLSNLAPGTYFLRVLSGVNQIEEFKIVLAKH